MKPLLLVSCCCEILDKANENVLSVLYTQADFHNGLTFIIAYAYKSFLYFNVMFKYQHKKQQAQKGYERVSHTGKTKNTHRFPKVQLWFPPDQDPRALRSL